MSFSFSLEGQRNRETWFLGFSLEFKTMTRHETGFQGSHLFNFINGKGQHLYHGAIHQFCAKMFTFYAKIFTFHLKIFSEMLFHAKQTCPYCIHFHEIYLIPSLFRIGKCHQFSLLL
ncbi:hypothetical protein AMTRI_Chr04g252900 [Amborella trichopoda]